MEALDGDLEILSGYSVEKIKELADKCEKLASACEKSNEDKEDLIKQLEQEKAKVANL